MLFEKFKIKVNYIFKLIIELFNCNKSRLLFYKRTEEVI